eukprot:scaffold11065_cov115-Cylindrotheca_fusiformis.AAC.3
MIALAISRISAFTMSADSIIAFIKYFKLTHIVVLPFFTMQHPEEGEDEAWIYSGQEEVPPTVRRVKIAENVIEIPDRTFQVHQELEEVFSFLFGSSNRERRLSLVQNVEVHSVPRPRERRSWHSIKCQKLGRLVDDEADLNHRLKHRFDNSPLNKLCYYQSYQSSEDAMAQLTA